MSDLYRNKIWTGQLMNRAAFLVGVLGILSVLQDGRLAPEQMSAIRAHARDVPFEIRNDLHEGGASLPEDYERTRKAIMALPAQAAVSWGGIRTRVRDTMADARRFTERYIGGPASIADSGPH
jgi:hypothetical protein